MKFFTPRGTTLDEQALLEEQVRVGVRNFATVCLFKVLCTSATYLVIRNISDSNQLHLNLWAASQFLLSAMWFYLYWRYADDPSPLYKYWRLWIELPAAIWAGANWGLAWVLFIDPDNLHTAFFLNTMLCGVAIGMVVTTPISERVVLASLVPFLIPVVIKALSIGGALFTWFGVVAFLFLIACYAFFRNMQDLYYSTLEEREKSLKLAVALEHEKSQIEKISQEKTRFLASASHDLRQPIQAMYFFQSALAELVVEPEQKKLLTKIGEANNGLSKMLEPLLDISKLDSGIVVSSPEPIWIDDLLYQVEKQYEKRAALKGIELRIMQAGDHQVLADPHHLERILNNLIENAIKHMGRSGKILVGVRPKGECLNIEVHDNGKGISDNEKEKIFDEFYQVDNPERNSAKGLGLGLPITKRLVMLNGGEISLLSSLEKGSCFRVKMPLYRSNYTDDESRLEYSVTDAKQTPEWSFESGKTVYVIEDDLEVAAAQSVLFERWGFIVRIANSIESALQHLETSTPDIIVTDYQLSNNQTGLQAIEQIRIQVPHYIPAVILTGNTRPETVKALSEQSTPVLFKPVEASELKNIISKTLNDGVLLEAL